LRVTKVLTTSVTAAALAFSMLASAIPATATSSGYHAAWVAQSAYATAAPGQVVQMSAVYQNTGDQPWIKGTAGQQANFAAGSSKDPAFPRDTTAYNDAGWGMGQNWLSANRFAAQANDLVATSQLGSWVWSVKVPANQAAGVVNFNGNPVVDGTAWMEDYGFFLQVTVSASPLTATTTPASPSTNTTPTVSGTGAPAAGAVTVSEGSTTLCSTVADSAGNYACQSSALAAGSHTITVTATNGSVTITYVVDTTKPTISNAVNTTPVKVLVTFSKAMNVATTGAGTGNPANFYLDSTSGTCVFAAGNAVTAASPSTDGTQATLTLTTALTPGTGHTLNVCNTADAAGNVIVSPSNFAFLAVATPPTISSVTSTAGTPTSTTTNTVKVKWNQAVNCTLASYSVNGIAVTATTAGPATTCTLTTAQTLTAGVTYTLTAQNETNGTSTQSPNPQSVAFTVAAQGTLTISSVAQGSSEKSIDATFSSAVNGAGTYNLYANGALLASNNPATGGGAITVDTTNAAIVHFVWTTATTFSNSFTFQIQNETSTSGATLQSPNPYSTAVTLTANTTPPSVVSVTSNAAGNQLTITFSQCVTLPSGTPTGSSKMTLSSGSTLKYSTDAADQVAAPAGPGAATLAETIGAAGSCATGSKTVTAATTAANNEGTAAAFTAGFYTVSIGSGNVMSTATTAVANAAATPGVTVPDATIPTVASATYVNTTPYTLTVNFSENMSNAITGTGAANPANYTIDGAALPGTAVVACATSSCIQVTITLNAKPALGGHLLNVSGAITDKQGTAIGSSSSWAFTQ